MKTIQICGAVLALFIISASAQAMRITGTYAVHASSTDPGLKISTAGVAPSSFSYDLEVGESKTFDLFEIWTDESTVNWDDGEWDWDFSDGDDIVAKPITVGFDFLLPDLVTGSVNGVTDSVLLGFGFLFSLWGGEVSWGGPLDLFFGERNDGHIQITLSDEIFDAGAWGKLGDCAAIVEATLTLVKDATVVAVPAPGAMLLFGLGITGMFVAARRRQRAARLG